MHTLLRPALVAILLSTLVLGLVAPLAVTGAALALFPQQASGSLVEREGRLVGSALLGQDFRGDRWFHPRPSATASAPYDAAAGAASQLGPTSAALLSQVRERIEARGGGIVPADAVTASASGLDPHIGVANANAQVSRVAQARGLPEERVAALVREVTEGRELGILGEPRINVLRLNLALDALR